jgi:hypothetical protein
MWEPYYAIHFFLECPLYQHDRTSLFNYFNNIVPISIEYILFGCNVISEELNTLLFKSVQTFIKQYTFILYNDFIVNIYIQWDWEQVFTTY